MSTNRVVSTDASTVPASGAMDAGAGLAPAAPSGRRSKSKKNDNLLVVWGGRILVLVVILGVWQLISATGMVGKLFLAQPSDIWGVLGQLVVTGQFWHDVWTTTEELLLGLLIGGAAGVLAGFGLAYARTLFRILDPILAAFNTLPRPALAPLFLIWFGIGMWSKVALAVSLVFFMMLYNSYSGVQAIDRDAVDVLKTMNASRLLIARRIIIPATASWVISGLRISIVYSFLAVVTGEMLIAQYGLGASLQGFSGSFNTAGIFAMLVVIGIMAALINAAVTMIEKRALRWRG
jgi:NitT/TauT family transport system permease protein